MTKKEIKDTTKSIIAQKLSTAKLQFITNGLAKTQAPNSVKNTVFACKQEYTREIALHNASQPLNWQIIPAPSEPIYVPKNPEQTAANNGLNNKLP